MARLRWLVVVVLSVAWLAGCATAANAPVIRLRELRRLPVEPAGGVAPLRVAVAAVVSPKGTAESYQPLLAYLSQRLGRPVELVQRRTYAETNALIEQGQVDLAFVCTSAYIAGRDAFGMELLAAPQVNGATAYRSYLIVPAASPARDLADLRQRVFAFTDPMSFSGRIYPSYLVRRLGSSPEAFFARTFFTYSHDDAIRAVAEGLADGAAVDSLVYEFALAHDPALARRVRIIERSPPFGIPPVVVHPAVRPQLRALLQELLLGLASEPSGEGQRALAALGVERFVLIGDERYDSARAIVRAVEAPAP
jgi:phosphonate transport system substrate-binding protein